MMATLAQQYVGANLKLFHYHLCIMFLPIKLKKEHIVMRTCVITKSFCGALS